MSSQYGQTRRGDFGRLSNPAQGAAAFDASVERARAQLALVFERRAERRREAVAKFLCDIDAMPSHAIVTDE
jgi:hypothetical protein